MLLYADTSHRQNDELGLLDEDQSMDVDDEIQGTEAPDSVRSQASAPAVLDSSILPREVFVMLGTGWFGGLILRQSEHGTVARNYRGDPDTVMGS